MYSNLVNLQVCYTVSVTNLKYVGRALSLFSPLCPYKKGSCLPAVTENWELYFVASVSRKTTL